MAYTEKIAMVEVKDLKPYAKNAKKHSKEQVEKIAESIKRFGFVSPCLIDGEKNIIAGHGRLMAAKKLGMHAVPCVFVDGMTDEERRAYILADNRMTEISEWDIDLVQSELLCLRDCGFDISVIGFDDIFAHADSCSAEEDDLQEDAVVESRVRLGDVYQLGEHRLMCGDGTDEKAVSELMGGAMADMVFTDPPYQLDTQGGGILKAANSMKQIRDNRVDRFDPSRLSMHGKTNVFFHNKPLIKAYIELAEKNGMAYDLAFYKKKNSVPNYKGHMMTDVEYIAIIGNQDPNKGLDKETYSKCFIGQKDSDNSLSYSKPVAICAKYVQLYSNDVVLDLFGGSGSTMIACEQLGRKCYMMELDPHYCDVIIARWEAFTGKEAVRVVEG